MGSPLSAVLAQPFMETLEADHYRSIVGRNVVWLRYVDDILAIGQSGTKVLGKVLRVLFIAQRWHCHRRLRHLWAISKTRKTFSVDFSLRLYQSGRPCQISTDLMLKPTNKDYFVHYFSVHSKRTKEGVVIGSFLRALRICSPEFLEEEMQHVCNTSIIRALCSPTSDARPKGLLADREIATSSGKNIGDVVREKRSNHNRPLGQVYSIPCGGCDKVYIGETARGLHEQRISQHRSALRRHDTRSAFVVHANTDGHLPEWSQPSIIRLEGFTIWHERVESITKGRHFPAPLLSLIRMERSLNILTSFVSSSNTHDLTPYPPVPPAVPLRSDAILQQSLRSSLIKGKERSVLYINAGAVWHI
ncbi:uncharacterized protein [Penaeus vannamei]|uniref:uncharacterized protein n=1 Tax=Penaeus vannamei TaxID=6689 RepID=UPI00387FA176